MPEKITRCSKPKSRLNLSNLVLPSTASQLSTLAARMSIFIKSSKLACSATGANFEVSAAGAASAAAMLCLLASIKLSTCCCSTRCIKCWYLLMLWPSERCFSASAQASCGRFKNPAACSATCGSTGARYTLSVLKALINSLHTSCRRASCPSCLAKSHGLLASTYSFTASAKAMMSRRARAYSRFS